MTTFKAGFSDNSGATQVTTEDDKAVAVTTWGCDCCRPEPSAETVARARFVAEAMNLVHEMVAWRSPESASNRAKQILEMFEWERKNLKQTQDEDGWVDRDAVWK